MTKPSLLSRSLSQVRSYSRNSTTTIDVAITFEGAVLHQSTTGHQCYDKKQAQAIEKLHLVGNKARLGVASRMLSVVSTTSYHEHWSRVSFNISCEEECFF
jgi:hypothetical protein